MECDLINASSGIIGAIVGGVGTYFASTRLDKKQREDKSSSLKSALVKEVEAMLFIASQRNYLLGLQTRTKDLENSDKNARLKMQIKIPSHYSRIFQTHAGEIGLLDEKLSSNIVYFHQLIDSLVQDVTVGGVLYEGGTLNNYKEAINIFTAALIVGEEIIGREMSQSVQSQ